MAQTAPAPRRPRTSAGPSTPPRDPTPRPAPSPASCSPTAPPVELRYDPASTRYGVFEAGAGLAGAAPANVLVMQVPVAASQYKDVTGAVTPYTGTIGGGVVDVLRDGTRVTGRWERPTPADGTRLVDAAGAPIALKPGPTWVLLQPAGLPATIG
jgi:hypothetical protein